MEKKFESFRQKPKLASKRRTISYIDQTVIGFKDVKELLSLYSEMLKKVKPENRVNVKGELEFLLSNRIKNFDITFIAALNLIKFSFKKIQITLRFDGLENLNSEEGKCYYRFGHFYSASALSYGEEVYRIILNGSPQKFHHFREKLTGYLPFIYVEKESIKSLFHEPFKITWNNWWEKYGPSSADIFGEKITSDEDIYQALRKFIITKLDLKDTVGNRKNNLDNFYMNYIFKAARKINFIKKILKNQAGVIASAREKELLFKISSSPLSIKLTADGYRKYEREVQNIFDKILGKPPAFVVLFSYFIEKFYNIGEEKKESDEDEIKKRVEAISNIFHFTNEIFYGLKELVKNIVEHSSTGRGIIIGRVLDRRNLAVLKKEMHIESYLQDRGENEFIDLIILDDGAIGIIEKTIQNLQTLSQEFQNTPNALPKFHEDIENLSQDKVVLGDFFDLHEIKLNYQQIRSALSLGLLIFSHLVRENNGFMMVSSPHRDKIDGLVLFKGIVNNAAIDNIIPMGTFYNIIFPKNLERSLTPRSEIVPFEMPSGESAFIKLSRLIRNCVEISKQTSPGEDETDSYKNRICLLDIEPEIFLTVEKLRNIFQKCEGCLANGKSQKILTLNLEKIASNLDPLDLFKYLANLQITRDIKSIIVYNVWKETVERIIELFEIFKVLDLKIGSNDHFVLFYYSDQEKTGGDEEKKAWVECYYLFLLAGETWDDLYWINKKIEKSNLAQEDLLKKGVNEDIRASVEFQNNYISNPLFTPEGHLIPFDVVIEKRIKNRVLTLFEWNVMADLSKVADPNPSRRYKFIDAHMRLGSKIHISDFFYARRIFQNSFYSLRFAFLITQYIEQKFASQKKKSPEGADKKKQLTVVGYGMYSELLISNIARFLRNSHSDWEIEHALIDEVEIPKVTGKIYPEILLIIPISSTLSTSIKIEQHFKKNSSRIKEFPINVILVGNGELESLIDGEGNVTDKTVEHFWKKIDINNNIITTQFLEKKEKFFLFLSSKWYLPQDCPYCFPTTPSDESVLFETDKVSFTPSLIFELPLSKPKTDLSYEIYFGIAENKKEGEARAVVTPDILIYGHASRENNHYLYYIETRDFLRMNKESLKEWLGNVKRELTSKDKKAVIEKLFESKIILIAPAHDTNADFLNLVNEVIFNDVATIFHYEQNEDYIQNLRSFVSVDIARDAYVFYIDDAVSSGKTFEKINNFVKYAWKDHNRGVDGAFILINRLTQDRHSVLTRELQKCGFFAFVDLDVPIMIDSEKFCHLCVEKKKFEKMLDETILDSLRILIRCKTWKLEPREYLEYLKFKESKDPKSLINFEIKYIPRQKYIFFNQENQQKYLQRIEIVHRLYRGFSDEGGKGKQKIEEIIKGYRSLKELWKAINISHSKPDELTEDEKVSLIKVLSYPYFVYHKDIRKYIFKSIIWELDRVISVLMNTISNRDLMDSDWDTFRYLKFLIKRSASLKANYLIHKDVLMKIIRLIDHIQEKLDKDTGDKRHRDLFTPVLSDKTKGAFIPTVNQFIDFFTLAVKEVVWYNEAKSLRLEKTLDVMIDDCGNAAGTCSLLTDALRIENISILFQFINLIKDEISGIDSLHFTERHYVEDHQSLSENLIRYCKDNPYRSSSFLSFLGLDRDMDSIDISTERMESFLNDSAIFNERILPELLLKAFFLNEKKEKGGKGQIKTKMNYILFLLCKILGIDSDEGGAFFVVKPIDTSNRSFGSNMYMVGHIGVKKEMYSFEWDSSMIMKVFDGKCQKFDSLPITYFQVTKKESGYFSQFGQEIKSDDISEIKYLAGMNSFLFLRIAAPDENCTANGGLVFYSRKMKPIPSEIFRYALLLKSEIHDFLKKNYDNDSFRLWTENEKIDEYLGYFLHRVKRNIVNPLETRKILMPNGSEDIEYKDILNNIVKKLSSYSRILSKYNDDKIFEIDFPGTFDKIIQDFNNAGFPGKIPGKIIYSNEVPGKLWLRIPLPISGELTPEGIFEDLLMVIVDNILENAFDENKGNASRVDILSFLEKGYVVIHIKDNGKGIKFKTPVLNGSFYSPHGLGLGIQIIRDTAVGLLGGNFDLKSIEDGVNGTLIIIKLPIHQEKKNG